ncbi:MAG: FKBP-type peptidyl-prolyl cis-trans isomerase [Cyanobacteria bacterium]|nr:FKBP-type peptidyl-prolyl cis-trans isomerase [Cyanobacteriota bacterium]
MRLFPLVVLCAVAVSACRGSDSSPTAPSANVPFSITELRVGTGAEATNGRNVTVNYSGWVWDRLGTDNKGSRFDAGTYSLTLPGNVITGFSQGIVGMRVGGLRRVVIPPNLGYGNNPPSNSVIRPNETLIFEIELLAVQ